MENFIDVLLTLMIIVVIVITGSLIFLFIKYPITGYWVMWSAIGMMLIGIGGISWKFYQKKRMGSYNETLKELIQLHKEIIRSTRGLEPSLKKAIRAHFPKMRQLRYEARRRIYKILAIEKDLHQAEKQQFTSSPLSLPRTTTQRYQLNIKTIEQAKSLYIKDTQHIIRFFHEMNSQILALKYANEKAAIQNKIAEMIDDLLIDMQALEEITAKYPE